MALLPVAYYTGDDFKPGTRKAAAEVTYFNQWRAKGHAVSRSWALSDLEVQDDPFGYYRERLSRARSGTRTTPTSTSSAVTPKLGPRSMDVATFSSRPAAKLGPADRATLAYLKVLSERGWARTPTLQRTDPPVHTRDRKLLNRVFTPAARE